MLKMSSISAQGVVERASAELSKRINGLGLRSKHHHSGSGGGSGSKSGDGKASVMERVTNVLCGGSSSSSNNSSSSSSSSSSSNTAGNVSIQTAGQSQSGGGHAPEKPSRISNPSGGTAGGTAGSGGGKGTASGILGTGGSSKSQSNTPQSMRKIPHHHGPHGSGGGGGGGGGMNHHHHGGKLGLTGHQGQLALPQILTIEQLLQDERFLARFFLYFTSFERCTLAQVCQKWRDLLYRSPRYWSGLVPVLQCRELRQTTNQDRVKLYNSLIRRSFHAVCLMGATDEDALDLVHSFPLASKHVHSLSLRCSSISDRGLEALLDHLQSLFELELAGCNEITEAGLWACLTPRIVSLSLADCINVADEAVGAVAQLLPSLYEFSLQAYHVTDAALGYFSPKQSHSLSILRLQSCWELTNHGVVNIVHSLPHLTVLSLSGCSKVTDDGVELIAENLQKLRALDLSWCPRITDAALEYIACDLNQLEELTLDRCVHITDIGVGYISTMLSLSALFLRWCTQIRDFGLQHLCSMRNLQVLSLAGCPLLTSSGLSSLIQLRHLQELELTNCPGASHELFDYLREHLPRCLLIE
ncbi:F-box/LRR-repeat protein 16-like [Anopheles albimanus]|nr:F-box/LRR-repeat protein 16-like [Anopheles albimanus]XP_035792579.1 F-box/LRR-repeat protein 16-like [Anopheles albimanus]XP_035792580.1 F-box/LRR-repeat protein 16-like [Anopheles albimanus]XP_035792581.1 F-box/LRR-repeat protein 16-like [Anopheles albimanus]XP_035792582.1 F-box/LRR-repeat protein 16-like [Anopheles albimanus]XP_035792583.1 F-box/LRR-repeat protein 16-like [Anopheles albimanus]XP_035792584.1 F-box/LRR-repeat protein 16-like [Anopheles albimanus]XP_035792585.1 F-box/LRR-